MYKVAVEKITESRLLKVYTPTQGHLPRRKGNKALMDFIRIIKRKFTAQMAENGGK